MSYIFRSVDGGKSWTRINNNLTTRAVTSLSLSTDGQHLYAATNGEGVFRLDLNGQPPASLLLPASTETTPQETPSMIINSTDDEIGKTAPGNRNLNLYIVLISVVVIISLAGFLIIKYRRNNRPRV